MSRICGRIQDWPSRSASMYASTLELECDPGHPDMNAMSRLLSTQRDRFRCDSVEGSRRDRRRVVSPSSRDSSCGIDHKDARVAKEEVSACPRGVYEERQRQARCEGKEKRDSASAKASHEPVKSVIGCIQRRSPFPSLVSPPDLRPRPQIAHKGPNVHGPSPIEDMLMNPFYMS